MKTQKTWFITGASRGFGLEITKAVLASGDQIIASVRSNPEAFAAQFSNDKNLYAVSLDITNEHQARAVVQQAIDHFEKIDVLVNNAGYGIIGAVEETSDAEAKQNFEVNVFGTLNVIRAVLPFMRKERSGHIINISSVGGLFGYVGWGIYGSSKFAIEGITESLAQELAPLGIFATVVAPGFFRTGFLDKGSLTSTATVIEDYARVLLKEKIKIRLFGKAYAVAVILQAPVCL
ncbi:SDR family oxidoreductase [Pedobacter sp. MC2016-15]|uniref:SDR family oxidoreductase n=1 Tax=Pedobacter sp. MC2016-15 TaxID=2994473 RepID=UPI0022466500|nr:SDR family oxidoreductase [Pedobacter sp. MC2016-15]MCX2481035.1 SDR family oxidoreductase [Pedobacter sp. MC2016-15]